MKKGKIILALFLLCILGIFGCGKKSECEIPTRHVHKYTKGFSDGTTITKYLDSEYLNHFGYKSIFNTYQKNMHFSINL